MDDPLIVAGVTQDLVSLGLNADRPDQICRCAVWVVVEVENLPWLRRVVRMLARLDEALQQVEAWVQERVKVD